MKIPRTPRIGYGTIDRVYMFTAGALIGLAVGMLIGMCLNVAPPADITVPSSSVPAAIVIPMFSKSCDK